MSYLRARCVEVLAASLFVLLVDMIAALAGVVDVTAFGLACGLAFVVAATALVLLWASRPIEGVPSW